MPQVIENTTFGEERALYGSRGLTLRRCAFDGAEDGESALKECSDITVEETRCNLRYPFWHCHGLKIVNSEMTPLCRAALWYSDRVAITGTHMHGIKALRECTDITLDRCDIVSPEFGWSVSNMKMSNTSVEGEYFMLRSGGLALENVTLKGKYSFQYVTDMTVDNCVFDTKDAFWHTENVTVRDSEINGEYLAWYSHNLTLINCRISGTQPFCYCRGLRLVDCEMNGADFAFEKSEVDATLTAPVISIKNPAAGTIRVPGVGQIIADDPTAFGTVIVAGQTAYTGDIRG